MHMTVYTHTHMYLQGLVNVYDILSITACQLLYQSWALLSMGRQGESYFLRSLQPSAKTGNEPSLRMQTLHSYIAS